MPLELANDIKLLTFFGWAYWYIEEMTPLLAQMKGLESLHLKCAHEILLPTSAQQEFINAIISNNQDTLCVFNLEISLEGLITLFNNTVWENYIVKAIQCCKKLVTLSLPRIEMSINSYRELIAALPNLQTLNIYGLPTIDANWNHDDLKLLFSASTGNRKYIYFESSPSGLPSEL